MTQGQDSRTYFASFDEKDFPTRLLAKIEEARKGEELAAIRNRIARAYLYYYGFDEEGFHKTSSISRGGEQGELAEFRVNHSRNVVNTLLNLVISQRVVWQPKATNIDYESLKQVEVAKAVLEYYWTEKRVEGFIYKATEEAIALSEGFVLGLWDSFAGEDVEGELAMPAEDPTLPALPPQAAKTFFTPHDGSAPLAPPPDVAAPAEPDLDLDSLTNQKTGDFTFENVSTNCVTRDPTKNSWDALDWVSIEVRRNKFDLAAQYPEYEEDILSAPSDLTGKDGLGKQITNESDDIPVHIFFHRRSPAIPGGREAWVLNNKVVLRDGSLTYDTIPLFRIAPADIIGTPFGYTAHFEILGIQELMDSLHSTAATNLTTFGTQNIYIPSGATVQPEQLHGGMRIIEGGPGGEKPEALQLCQTPAELYGYLKELKMDLELVFGVNSVVRGQVQSDKLSGAALALLETQIKQQASGLHTSYRVAVQRLGDFVVNEMRKRASAPRTVNIIGKDNAFLVVKEQSFKGEDFDAIKRVLVDIGNPLSQSVFGRAEQAKELVSMGLINNLEQYFMMLDSGRTEPITQALTSELLLIRSENEDIAAGTCPEVMLHDNHLLHGREHRSPVASPQARKNPQVLKADIDHMHKHYEAYFGVPPMQPQVDPMGMPLMDPTTGMPVVDPETGQPPLAPEPMYRMRMLVLMGMQPPDPALGGIAPQPGMPGAPGSPGPGSAAGPAQPPPGQDPQQNSPGMPGKEPGQAAQQPKQPSMPTDPSTGQKWSPGGAPA